MSGCAAEKAAVRETMARDDRRLSVARREEAGRAVAAALAALAPFAGASVVGAYLALPDEVPAAPALAGCYARGQRVCVPAFDERQDTYGLVRLEPETETAAGKYGVAEPTRREWVAIDAVDAILVPGLAFDEKGARLGRGAGHYDRMLAHARAYKVGVTFECRIVTQLPVDPHDVPVDAIVTEQRTRVLRSRTDSSDAGN